MKLLSILLAVAFAGALGMAVMARKDANHLRATIDGLNAEIKRLKEDHAAALAQMAKQRDFDLKKLRAEAQDVIRLRNEVTQLRLGVRDDEKLRAENEKLKAQNQQLAGAAVAATAETKPAPEASHDVFPKDAWTFAGYDSPEAGMISAVWAMMEGNPKVYFDSLTSSEQERIAKTWEGKTEEEIALKHQQDVSKIGAINILDRQVISPTEVLMTVKVAGPDGKTGRTVQVPMYLTEEKTWKFGGFQGVPKPAAGR